MFWQMEGVARVLYVTPYHDRNFSSAKTAPASPTMKYNLGQLLSACVFTLIKVCMSMPLKDEGADF